MPGPDQTTMNTTHDYLDRILRASHWGSTPGRPIDADEEAA